MPSRVAKISFVSLEFELLFEPALNSRHNARAQEPADVTDPM